MVPGWHMGGSRMLSNEAFLKVACGFMIGFRAPSQGNPVALPWEGGFCTLIMSQNRLTAWGSS